jgi:outer membrane phospholipase A
MHGPGQLCRPAQDGRRIRNVHLQKRSSLCPLGRQRALLMNLISRLLLITCSSALTLHARVDLLLVPPTEIIDASAGQTFTLFVNNPTEKDETLVLPALLEAEYGSSAGHGRVLLNLVNPSDAERTVKAMTRLTVPLRLTEPLKAGTGFVSLRLTHPASNPIMFEIRGNLATADAGAVEAPRRMPLAPGHQLDLTTDIESMRRHVSAYDPIYFTIGSRDRLNARFQFSFKYRMFEPGLESDPWFQQLPRELYGAYTQTSIWDLEGFSKPFYDTSYKPTVFLLHEFARPAGSDLAYSVQFGVQHESNGKGGGPADVSPASGLGSPGTAARHPSDSRSVNSLYLAPKIRWMNDEGLFFEAASRASLYTQIDENPDLPRFRGYVEVSLRAGYDRGFQLSAHLRGHPQGHGSGEINATWPAIETPLFKYIVPRTLGGYAQLQYFNGYGESLLDYDVRRRDQLRFGIMLVR